MKNSGAAKHTQAREHSSFLPSPYKLLTSHFYSFLLIWQIRHTDAWLQFKSGHGMLCFFPPLGSLPVSVLGFTLILAGDAVHRWSQVCLGSKVP